MSVWPALPLSEVATLINGLWKGEGPPFTAAKVLRNTNFRANGFLDHSDVATIEVETRKLEKRQLRFGDIILEKSGGGPKQPVGRVAFFDKHEEGYSFSNFTAAIRVNHIEQLAPEFLHRFLYWTYLSGATEGMQSHSTGIRNLDSDAYKALRVPLPPLTEQHRIVAILDEVFAGLATATANAEKSLMNSRELFDGLVRSLLEAARGGSELACKAC